MVHPINLGVSVHQVVKLIINEYLLLYLPTIIINFIYQKFRQNKI